MKNAAGPILMRSARRGHQRAASGRDGYLGISTQSWRELLQQLKRQGLTARFIKGPLVMDSMGFWLALQENCGKIPQVFNVAGCKNRQTSMDKLPRSVKGRRQRIDPRNVSDKKATGKTDFGVSMIRSPTVTSQVHKSQPTARKKTRNGSFTWYDFTAQHWSHLRTTKNNRINLCYRAPCTQRNQGCGHGSPSFSHGLQTRLSKPRKHWPDSNGSALLPKVVNRCQFIDGEELQEQGLKLF